MKKIGILTFHWADNFGAVLQAYALCSYLNSLGIECEIINYRNQILEKPYKLWLSPLYLLKEYGFVKGIKNIFGSIIYMPRKISVKHYFDAFRKKYLQIGEKIDNDTFFEFIDKNYHSVIVGSDQVWNPEFTQYAPDIFFLNGTYSGNKFSYAASCAINLNSIQINEIINSISDFSLLSIREQETIINLDCNLKIFNVLDPVFLLDFENWKRMFSKIKNPKPFIFVYDLIVTPKIIETANFYSRLLNIPIISYSNNKRYNNSFNKKIKPNDFIKLIHDSYLVITNSFHGLAFSIIFRKDFYVLMHPTRGSRMMELLSKFKLNDRLIVNLTPSFSNIDYQTSDQHIVNEISNSKLFINRLVEIHNEN